MMKSTRTPESTEYERMIDFALSNKMLLYSLAEEWRCSSDFPCTKLLIQDLSAAALVVEDLKCLV